MTQWIVIMWLLLIVLVLVDIMLIATSIATHVITNITIVTVLMVVLRRLWSLWFSMCLIQDDIMQWIGERAFVRQRRLAASEFDP